jgi:hypothetical protein
MSTHLQSGRTASTAPGNSVATSEALRIAGEGHSIIGFRGLYLLVAL